jgi:hypothetical protein
MCPPQRQLMRQSFGMMLKNVCVGVYNRGVKSKSDCLARLSMGLLSGVLPYR